jgi:hypothetical protein
MPFKKTNQARHRQVDLLFLPEEIGDGDLM